MGAISKKLHEIQRRESMLMEAYIEHADTCLERMWNGDSIGADRLCYYATQYDRAVRMAKRSYRISGLCNKILKVIGK